LGAAATAAEAVSAAQTEEAQRKDAADAECTIFIDLYHKANN